MDEAVRLRTLQRATLVAQENGCVQRWRASLPGAGGWTTLTEALLHCPSSQSLLALEALLRSPQALITASPEVAATARAAAKVRSGPAQLCRSQPPRPRRLQYRVSLAPHPARHPAPGTRTRGSSD